MNKLRFLFLFSFFAFSINGIAQNEVDIAVNEFTSNKETKYITSITNKVIEMISKSNGQLNVLDRTELDKIKKELYVQAGEEFMNSDITVEQGKLLKAKYLLSGNVEVISISRKRNASGNILGYYCTISITLKIVEIETNRTKSIESFKTKKTKGMSPETSILLALETIEKSLGKYFKKQLI